MVLRELGKVEYLLSLTLALIKQGEEAFAEPMCRLLATLSQPFVKKSAADEFRASNLVSSLLAHVGECFAPEVPADVQVAAADLIASHASAYGNRPTVLTLANASEADVDNDLDLRTFMTNQHLVARSGVVATVVRGLASALEARQTALVSALVNAVTQLSYDRDNCAALVDAGALVALADAFPADLRSAVLPQCVEALWNLLGSGEGALPAAALEALPTLVNRLSTLLYSLCVKGFREADKEIRNELVVLLYLAAGHGEGREAVREAGALETLVELAVCPEVRPAAEETRRNTLTRDPLDLQLRELVWNALHRMSEDDVSRARLVGEGFLDCLLLYMDSDADLVRDLRVDPVQYLQRRNQALTLLRFLVPQCAGAFVERGGARSLLRFLQQCDDVAGVERGLALLLVAAAREECVPDLAEGGAVDLLLALALDRQQTEEARTACYLTLAQLGDMGAAFVDQFRASNGVAHVQQELARACSRDPTLPSAHVAALVGAAWSCVCKSRRSLARFLVADGLDVLLDMLDVGALHLRSLLLSVLADVLVNPRAHPFFHEWRSGRSARPAARLLLELWREEEASRGVGAGATLANLERPLVGTGRRTSWMTQAQLNYTLRDPRKLQLMEAFMHGADGDSLLMKIYCCLGLLGWDSLGYLDAEDRVTLALVRGFVKLRQGEIWGDIQAEMQADGFDPTYPDHERIQMALENTQQVVWQIRAEQEGIDDRDSQAKAAEERAVYGRMVEQHALDVASRQYKKDTSGLSIKERQALKHKKESMIKSALRAEQTFAHLAGTKQRGGPDDGGPGGSPSSGARLSLTERGPSGRGAMSERAPSTRFALAGGPSARGLGADGGLRGRGAGARGGRHGRTLSSGGDAAPASPGQPRVMKTSSRTHIIGDAAWQPTVAEQRRVSQQGEGSPGSSLFHLPSQLQAVQEDGSRPVSGRGGHGGSPDGGAGAGPGQGAPGEPGVGVTRGAPSGSGAAASPGASPLPGGRVWRADEDSSPERPLTPDDDSSRSSSPAPGAGAGK